MNNRVVSPITRSKRVMQPNRPIRHGEVPSSDYSADFLNIGNFIGVYIQGKLVRISVLNVINYQVLVKSEFITCTHACKRSNFEEGVCVLKEELVVKLPGVNKRRISISR
jgi:hypothetical protein